MQPAESGSEKRDTAAVVVTGVGLVTPVGHDSASAAAAVRAGISRFRRVPLFMTRSGAGTAGASASGLTKDRSGSDRLLALAIPAAAEALAEAEELSGDLDLARTRLLLCLAPPERPAYEAFTRKDLVALLEGADAPELLGDTELFRDGHAGGALAFRRAAELLRAGKADCCVVGGVDALVEFPALTWLSEAGRLKTDDHADGLMPGEAAAFLVLETEALARRRRATVLAEIASPAHHREEGHVLAGQPCRGVGLTHALRETLGASPAAPDGILCDLNGEYYRSKEWSLAMGRVFEHLPSVPPLWHPASSIGDVGSASLPVFAALAVCAVRRGYFPGPDLLLWASSDTGGRGSVTVRRPPGGASR